MQRRTRIVATLGPATDRPGVLENLVRTGLDVARINFSHGQAEEHLGRIARFREVSRTLGRWTAVLVDLPGPKLRVRLAAPIELAAGRKLTIATQPGAAADVTITEPEALAKVAVGHRVLLDDGRLQGRVAEVRDGVVTLVIDVGGTLQPNKGVNLPDSELTLPAVTERDRQVLTAIARTDIDWLALSFVRGAAAADELRRVASGLGIHVPVLAKMERPEAVEQAADIIQAFDGIMVARGDLGVEIALEKVPHVQKQLIFLARAAGKPVITATDMLDSMRTNPRPTRAEASDVANAVYDGTDAVMLSGETAAGQYPVEALTCMERILRETENHLQFDGPRELDLPRGELVDHFSEWTCKLAHEIHAQAIIAPTITGRTARLVARHRPTCAIVAPASEESVLRRMALFWGVTPVPAPHLHAGEDRLNGAVHASFIHGAVKAGDLVMVLAGHPTEAGERFPTARVVRVGADGKAHEP